MDNNDKLYYKDADQETFRRYMRDVYTWTTCGLLLTALSALVVVTHPGVIKPVALVGIGLFLPMIGIAWWIKSNIKTMSLLVASLMFVLVTIVNGAFVSAFYQFCLEHNMIDSFLVVGAMFGGMSLLGYTTKKELIGFGNMKYMLPIGIAVATAINLYVHSSVMRSILIYTVVAFFVGITTSETQTIKNFMLKAESEGRIKNLDREALLGALTIYIDFVCMGVTIAINVINGAGRRRL